MSGRVQLQEPFTPTPLPKEAVTVTVARTVDEIMQVMAVRSIVYMGQQACPYAEEFDGNDFAGATHLIARVGSAPVGVVRMRWFCDFAKLERFTVVESYRDGLVPLAV